MSEMSVCVRRREPIRDSWNQLSTFDSTNSPDEYCNVGCAWILHFAFHYVLKRKNRGYIDTKGIGHIYIYIYIYLFIYLFIYAFIYLMSTLD